MYRLLIISLLFLASCSPEEMKKIYDTEREDTVKDISTVCMEGVTYWFGVHEPLSQRAVSFFAPKLTPEGKVVPCK
jgi:hypothetical protein